MEENAWLFYFSSLMNSDAGETRNCELRTRSCTKNLNEN